MSTALYRRYRPETFAEVIGQDHVTAPLRQALRTGQVNHAYLFSGPRGCGKTTSARILARILNCARNTEASPTDTPCGMCESCIELARGGPGSLDVVEIDAASHGGVDDARELRERATFAPARDRFKIFILDEAHMVTTQGFNALLKIVEEPPPHVKFVFATTEPDKVIGTIRSRTHHYPFRLVPPDVLLPYLEQLCAAEHVQVGGGVLPLVVRAGGGSVRDTLSVLDQLIAGSDEAGIAYEGAAALLGYTQGALLDDVVDAIAARDGGAAFRVVERVVATGHEPRRFVEDLLERLRDLIVIDAAGEAAGAALRGVPEDQLAAMRVQSARLGASELSRSADLANAALTEMTGATSPRLHLELLMARLLLPAADDGSTGLAARLDRLERGLPQPVDGARGPSSAGAPAATASPGVAAAASAPVPADARPAPASGAAAVRAALAAQRSGSAADPGRPGPQAGSPEPPREPSSTPDRPVAAPSPAVETPCASAPPVTAAPPPWDVPDEPADVETAPDERPSDEPTGQAAAPVEETRVPDELVSDELVSDEPVSDEPVSDEPVSDQPVPDDAAPDEPAPDEPAPDEPAPDEPDEPASVAREQVEPEPFEAAPVRAVNETETLRRRWPEVLDTVRSLRRVTGALVDPNNAQVAELDATTLRLSFTTPELAATFRNGPHAEVVGQAVRETLGFDVRVEATGGDTAGTSGAPAAAGHPNRSRGPAPTQRPSSSRTDAGPDPRAPQSRPGGAGRAVGPAAGPGGPDDSGPGPTGDPGDADAEGHRPVRDPASPGGEPDPYVDREPPAEDFDDPWQTPPPAAAHAAVSTRGARDTDPAPVLPAAPNAAPTGAPTGSPNAAPNGVPPAVPGVISAADAAASWGDPAPSAPQTPPQTPPQTAAQTPPQTRGQTPARAVPERHSPSSAQPSAPGARESAVQRAQRLAAAAAAEPRRDAPPPEPAREYDPYDDASPDDPDVASSGLVGAPLVAQLLGGTVIDEQVDDARG